MSVPKRFAVAGLCLALLGACSSKLPPGAVRIASISEIEQKVHHHLLQPGGPSAPSIINMVSGSLVMITESGYGAPTGSTFAGQVATILYSWGDFEVFIRQGRPVDGFTIRSALPRGDGVVEPKTSAGVEIVLYPAVGKATATAFRLQSGWLAIVDITPGNSKQAPTMDQLRELVNSLA
jgi:hypothetical protein